MKVAVDKLANVVARQALARKVLLRRRATRSELSRDTGLCAASVTHHTRWLLRHGFLTSTPIRVPDVKRSVDQLRVNGDQGTLLAIHVHSHQIQAQVLGLDAQPLTDFLVPVEEATQREVLAAVSRATQQAKHWAAGQGRGIDFAGMSVCGTVATEDSMVFGVDGVPQWQPCQPRLMLPAFEGIPALNVWTQVMSKMVGLSAAQRRDDRIAYVEFLGGSFHIASMRQGEVWLGRHGSTSSFLHESVSDSGRVCYCGRRGCLADLLESGEPVDVRILADAFVGLLHRVDVDALGLEWQGEKDWLVRRLTEAGIQVYVIDDGRNAALHGLRILTAQALLAHQLAHCD